MIISDRQLMELLNIAHSHACLASKEGNNEYSFKVTGLIDEITNQQSEELHTTKEEK